MSEYLEMPWSIEETIQNFIDLKKLLKEAVIAVDLHGKGKQDAEEIEVDFERAIKALEEIQQYRALEKHLSDIFEGDLSLSDVVNELDRYLKNPDSPHPVNAKILTYEDADMWETYKTIGTPDELKQLKENGAFTGLELAQIAAIQIEFKKYQAIGTLEGCRLAVEKQKPKKPLKIHCSKKTSYHCPNCGYIPLTLYVNGYCLGDKSDFCEKCGQAIDWSDT